MRYGTRVLIKQVAQAFTWIGGSLIGGSLFMLVATRPTDWDWLFGIPIGLSLGALALWLVPYFSGHVRD